MMQGNRTTRPLTWQCLFITALALLVLGSPLQATDENTTQIAEGLRSGLDLQNIVSLAYAQGGVDKTLSAGEAVTTIYSLATAGANVGDTAAWDIIKVTIAVIGAWPDCQDTFDAVKAAVELMPERAGEVVAQVAVKRDCNCYDGGLWAEQRLDERLRPEISDAIVDAPEMCSCSQVAMYAGVAGLPENREFSPDLPQQQKTELNNRLAERVADIMRQSAALQSKNGWECGCTDVNIASGIQGIAQEELRLGTYDLLPEQCFSEDSSIGCMQSDDGLALSCQSQIHDYLGNHPADVFVRRSKQRQFRLQGNQDMASPN